MSKKDNDKKQRRRQRKKATRLKKKRALGASGLQSRLESLRELIYETPSAHAWQQICALLERWPDDDTLPIGLDYADSHLRAWPGHMRGGPGLSQAWTLRQLAGHTEPRLQVVRAFCLQGHQVTRDRLKALFAMPFFDRAEGLLMPSSFTSPDVVVGLLGERCPPGLKSLDLSGSWSNSGSLNDLLKPGVLPPLERLDLSNTGRIDYDLEIILAAKSLASLKHLGLGRNRFTDEGLLELVRDPLIQGLEGLSLDGTQLSSGVLVDLLDPQNTRNFHTLSLARCGLNDDRCRYLAAAELPALTRLNMDRNAISSRGLRPLLGMDLPALKVLSLCHNRIGFDGLAALSEPATLPSLKTLRLEGNPFDTDTISNLFAMRRPTLSTPSLKGLSHNLIKREELQEMLGALNIPDLPPDAVLSVLRRIKQLGDSFTREAITACLTRAREEEPLEPRIRQWVSRNLWVLRVSTLKSHLRAAGDVGYSKLTKDGLIRRVRHVMLS